MSSKSVSADLSSVLAPRPRLPVLARRPTLPASRSPLDATAVFAAGLELNAVPSALSRAFLKSFIVIPSTRYCCPALPWEIAAVDRRSSLLILSTRSVSLRPPNPLSCASLTQSPPYLPPRLFSLLSSPVLTARSCQDVHFKSRRSRPKGGTRTDSVSR